MGVHYSFSLQVGFRFDQEDVHQHFRTVIPAIFHMEDRYDTRTGQKTGQVKVYDRHETSYIEINGEHLDDDSEAVSQALATLLDCDVETGGSYSSGDLEYFFMPHRTKKSESPLDYGHVSIHNPSMSFFEVRQMFAPLAKIELKLREIGLKPSEPQVYIGSSIG